MSRCILIIFSCSLVGMSGCAKHSWKNYETSILTNNGGIVESDINYLRVQIFASINGHPPERFLFDTGASVNSITPEAAKRLGLVAESETVVIDAGNNILTIPTVTIDRVEFGPVQQTGVQFTINEHIGSRFQRDLAGTIGYNGLQGFTVDLDLRNQKLSITNERLNPDLPHVRKTISYKHEMVYAPVEVLSESDWITVWCLLDTGGSGLLWFNQEYSQSLTFIEQSRYQDSAIGAHQLPWDLYAAPVVGPVRLGESIMDGVSAIVNQKSNNIGMSALRDFHIRIDGPSKLVSFERPDHAKHVVWLESLGLFPLNRDPAGWRPSFVIPGGVADSLGMTYNDVVLSIDGREPGGHLEWSEFWPIDIDATSVTLRVLRDGEEIDVVLPLGDSEEVE